MDLPTVCLHVTVEKLLARLLSLVASCSSRTESAPGETFLHQAVTDHVLRVDPPQVANHTFVDLVPERQQRQLANHIRKGTCYDRVENAARHRSLRESRC